MKLDRKMDMPSSHTLHLNPELLDIISEIDEFKGSWQALCTLAPERLAGLRRVATIESVGSSTRIEGNKLSDSEVAELLSRLSIRAFATRDEQEVAGYAETMDLVFQSFEDMQLTENHIRQLHRDLLRHSDKDERHRGEYKTLPNHVAAFDAQGRQIGIVFATASPFDTPRRMEELLRQTQGTLDSNRPDWQPWFLFFTRALRQQAWRLKAKLGAGRGKAGPGVSSCLILRKEKHHKNQKNREGQ